MQLLFWIHTAHTNNQGRAPITMRITINGQRAELKTGVTIEPDLWDKESQSITGSSPLIKQYNATLVGFATQAWTCYSKAITNKEAITAASVKNFILNKDQPKNGLLEAFMFHVANLKLRVGLDVAARTINNYLSVQRKLELYIPLKFGSADIPLSKLNKDIIADFDLYIRKQGLKHNAVVKNMQNFRSLLKVCMKHGWLEKDPFVYYSFRLDDTERGYLSPGELKTMEEILLPSDRLDHVRDIFIFCCYTGLAYADVSKLSKSHIEVGEDGIIWIKLNRSKTKSRSVIPLLPRAREILDKYNNYAETNAGKKLLPVISNQNLNKYLKEVAVLCGITKRMSMHLARHTFATTVTLGRGIDIMTVSKMLGHKNLRTTQIYSKVTELKIADDMKKLM